MKSSILALLVGAFVFLAPASSQAYGIADTFAYNNAPRAHSVRSASTRRHRSARKSSPTSLSRNHSFLSSARPKAWCGWWARQQKGVSSPSYNRAIHWLNYGSPTVPQIGAVVVWKHHVGIITGYDKRGWLVTSGNWNNRVATVPLSQMGRGVQGYRI